jgi:hypothetical protein
MKMSRNDPCPCGSGRKYKRCCLEHDEAREWEEATARGQAFSGAEHERNADDAVFAECLRMVVTKDRASLSAALERFADALATDPALRDVRFEDAAFTRVVARSFANPAQSPGLGARRRLFRVAIEDLGDRATVQRFHDQLAGTMASASLSASNREAIAVALICLDPVLSKRALPPRESPTLQIIFNNQLEGWPIGAGATLFQSE